MFGCFWCVTITGFQIEKNTNSFFSFKLTVISMIGMFPYTHGMITITARHPAILAESKKFMIAARMAMIVRLT